MQVKAVVYPENGKVETRVLHLRELGKEEIRTETLYSFVSAGTELRVMEGYYGAKNKFPLVPGYSYIAEIVETGRNVKGYKKGDLLCCRYGNDFMEAAAYWGGHASQHIVNVGNGSHVVLPEESKKDVLKYAVVEVAAISYRGVCAVSPECGESALVVGQGMIGCFTAEFLRMKGCRVTVCDIHKKRLENAAEAGYSYADLSEGSAEERLQTFAGGNMYDIVAECSGSSAGFLLANKMLRKPEWGKNIHMVKKTFPRLLIQANYVEDVPVNPSRFFTGEGALIVTPADRNYEDRATVAELIRRGELHTEAYTKNIFTPEEMPEVYNKLKNCEIASAVCKWKE